MLKGRRREKIALMVGAGIGLAYILISWFMMIAWEDSLRGIIEGPGGSADNYPNLPLLLRIFMLPIPSVSGSWALWPFIVQGLFICGALTASILRPHYITWAVSLAVLFVLLLLISGSFLASLYATLKWGLLLTGLLVGIGLEVSKRIRISKTTGFF